MELIGIKILKMRFLDEFGGIPYHIDHMGRESQEIRLSMIYGTPGPGTGWSGSVGNFKNFVGPGPVRDLELARCWVPDFEIFLGPGPVRDQPAFVRGSLGCTINSIKRYKLYRITYTV